MANAQDQLHKKPAKTFRSGTKVPAFCVSLHPVVRALASIAQVDCRSVEGFFWRSMPGSIVKEAGLVRLVTVSVECH